MLAHRRARAGRRKRYLSRWRDFYTPSITDGLLLNVPFRHDARPLHSAGGATGLSTETVDADGTRSRWQDDLIEQAIANTARVERLGVLSERARTAELLRSYSYEHAAWTKQGTATPSDGAAETTDPQGGSNASKINGIGATGVNDLSQALANGTFTNDANLGVGVWIKRISISGTLVLENPSGAAVGKWSVDLSALPAGWTRLTKSHAAVTVDNTFVASAAGAGGLSYYASAGAPLSFYLWVSGQEEGIAASSTIITAAASVARAADDFSYDNTSEVHCDAAAGTVIMVYTPSSTPGEDRYLFDARPAGKALGFYYRNANSRFTIAYYNAADAFKRIYGPGGGAPAADTPCVVAVTWTDGAQTVYRDGVAGTPGTENMLVATAGAVCDVGQVAGAAQAEGNMEHLLTFNRDLSEGEIQTITRKDCPRWVPTLSL